MPGNECSLLKDTLRNEPFSVWWEQEQWTQPPSLGSDPQALCGRGCGSISLSSNHPVVLKLQSFSKSPGDLFKHALLGHTLQAMRICVSDKFPGDAPATSTGPHFPIYCSFFLCQAFTEYHAPLRFS